MRTILLVLPLSLCSLATPALCADDPIIVDHGCTDITKIPPQWIEAAKQQLNIAYGHTSHGSQITEGMNGLVTFTGGVGGPQFAWNDGGTGGALDLHDYAMAGDVGSYPQWVNETRDYLDDPANSDVNVIIWSWCGQVSIYSAQDMIDRYLAPMTQLELDYPDVKFVYMTGHLNYWYMAHTNARNQQIRDYCIANDKILYDFAHIESFDPDGTYFPYANDDCSYWDASGTLIGNWATEWQNSHTEGVDWYYCYSAHSQPLNANQKAYAAWWLWARLAGWSEDDGSLTSDKTSISASTGGRVIFSLDAGQTNAKRNYWLLGSASGTSPGLRLRGGLVTLPLNPDRYMQRALLQANGPGFLNFHSRLDRSGRARATLNTLGPLPASMVGVQFHYAYLLSSPFDYVSNPVPVEITP